ncbi:hypothetical protein RRG08_057195 [Elysia crispata]|uniref:Uncharacterized protein n=1 Tax=Elysia crispata TaxID=231223 RepID=A0AAE1CNC2_9GAST|nr:hypothetical protein RRG08_057195 [Elysia crispata]
MDFDKINRLVFTSDSFTLWSTIKCIEMFATVVGDYLSLPAASHQAHQHAPGDVSRVRGGPPEITDGDTGETHWFLTSAC